MPVTVTIAEFRARFDEFSATPDADVEDAIEEALLIHNIRKLATLYCIAHLLSTPATTIRGGGGSSSGTITVNGEVTASQVGPLRIEHSTHSETASSVSSNSASQRSGTEIAFFSRTEYGRHFLILEMRSPRAGIGAMVV